MPHKQKSEVAKESVCKYCTKAEDVNKAHGRIKSWTVQAMYDENTIINYCLCGVTVIINKGVSVSSMTKKSHFL